MVGFLDPWKPTSDRKEDSHRRTSRDPCISVTLRSPCSHYLFVYSQDEVDDSRTTLGYAVAELKKDIAQQYERLTPEQKTHFPKTELAIFVVHNKLKEKLADLPDDVKYFPGENIEDKWVDYPWETENIELHEKLCQEQKALAASK